MRQFSKYRLLWALGFILLALAVTAASPRQTSDEDNVFVPPYPNFFVFNYGTAAEPYYCHKDGWGWAGNPSWCAYDYNSSINGGPLFSSINGTITGNSTEGYGNPYLIIENSRWKVIYLHGVYNVSVGQYVQAGQRVGTEANLGNSFGEHTHLTLYDKLTGKFVEPGTVYYGTVTYTDFPGDVLGQVSIDTIPEYLRDDGSPNPQPPGEVAWDTLDRSGIAEIENTEETQDSNPNNDVPLQEAVTEYWEKTYIQADHPLRAKLVETKNGWFFLVGALLILLWGNKGTRSWWPMWAVLLTGVIVAYVWSRSPVKASEPDSNTTTYVTENEPFESPPKPEEEVEIIFPRPPEPMANAYGYSSIIPSEVIQLSYTPQVLNFQTRPALLAGLDPGTQAWFEWLQQGNLQYETLWYWHDCKTLGISKEACGKKANYTYTASPPYEAVLAALTVHQLGGAPIWDNLTQKLQETGNGNGPFTTSSALAMGPLQEKQWFFNTFSAFPGGDMQIYLDAMLAHSNWAVSQGVMSHNTDQATYAHRYAGSPCDPPDINKCQYKGLFNNLMWNNYRGMGDAGYFISRALMESWLMFQEQFGSK
ncbi:MAG: hypothetical protein BroJett025_04010 [Patescibacteria group bacterium]|nr:MAG: hypothetical protein BroJett025_04010 [Patescibacteria group bacterium]